VVLKISLKKSINNIKTIYGNSEYYDEKRKAKDSLENGLECA